MKGVLFSMEKFSKYTRENKLVIISLLAALLIFLGCSYIVRPEKKEDAEYGDYAHYETAVVDTILKDNCTVDETLENNYRGEQMLIVSVKSGQYKGKQMQAFNYVGPLYGRPLSVGDKCTLIISTYADGTTRATVYEYARLVPIVIILLLFFAATIAVGGKNGAKSLVGLIITVLTLFMILIPALMKGAPTLLTTFAICVYISAVTYIIMDGIKTKTICAWIGTISGMAMAVLFACLAQYLLRIDGYRMENADAILILRQTGTPIGIKGLMTAGVMISALGAVMDTAISLSSAVQEVHEANKELKQRALFKSGMNIGRDIVGTMTNTLILALLGSSLVLVIYIYSLGLETHQLMSSSYVACEVVSTISSSIGIALAVPLTTLISSIAYANKKD